MQQDIGHATNDGGGKTLHEKLDLLTAASLASDGRFEEAEAILSRTAKQAESSAAMEMLARIAIQKGDLHGAERWWINVLEKNPRNEAAQLAISRLRSPWVAIAMFRRIGFLLTLAMIGGLSLAGMVTLFRGDYPILARPHESVPGPSLVERTPALVGPAIETEVSGGESSPPEMAVAEKPPNIPERSTSTPPPIFTVPGCRVTTNATETVICFEQGLFAYRDEFIDTGRERFEAVARIVAEYATGCWVIVEGHTDSDPMPPNSMFRDNYALGLHRAMVAADVLRAAASIPPEVILVASAGGRAPLFTETISEEKLKNRTVVIRLVPKANWLCRCAGEI